MEPTTTKNYKPVFLYLLFTFGFSSVFYFLIISNGKLGTGGGTYVVGLMYCPALAGLLTTKILKRKIADLGWSLGKLRYQLWSYLIPIIYSLVAYAAIWAFGFGRFYNHEFLGQIVQSFGWQKLPEGLVIFLYFILTGIYGMTRSVSTALGEEIGWRGFLVPEVYKNMGYTKTSLITGIIWAMWHFPILIFADYNSGTPAWYGLSCFTVMVVSISFVFTWFRIKSNSLWTGVLLHASHNLFIQRILTPITAYNEHTKYYIDEFGAVLPVVCFCLAVYYWSRRKELENTPAESVALPELAEA